MEENQMADNIDIENILKETPEAYNVFQKMPLTNAFRGKVFRVK